MVHIQKPELLIKVFFRGSNPDRWLIFIFLIAATASVLPISVGGGLGVREFVIIEGAKYAGLDQHTALVISLLFYVITVACSLIGLIFVFKNPLQKNDVK